MLYKISNAPQNYYTFSYVQFYFFFGSFQIIVRSFGRVS